MNILTALSLGDGNITKSGILRIGHSIKQEEYLKWKVGLLEKIYKQKIKIKQYTTTVKGKKYKTLTVFTPTDKRLKVFRKILYPNGKKRITTKVFKLLSPIGLAIWFMDDGGCYSCIGEVQIATYCSYEEILICQKYFKEKWNINWRIKKHSKNERYVLAKGWRSDDMIRFRKIIEPFIIPSMFYKIENIMPPKADNKKALYCKSCGIDLSKAKHKGAYCNPCRYERWKQRKV